MEEERVVPASSAGEHPKVHADTMLKAFLVPIAVAGVSALAFLAYNHPDGFRRLADVLYYLLLWIGSLGAALIGGGVMGSVQGMLRVAERDKDFPESVRDSLTSLDRDLTKLVRLVLVLLGIAAYLILLTLLPLVTT